MRYLKFKKYEPEISTQYNCNSQRRECLKLFLFRNNCVKGIYVTVRHGINTWVVCDGMYLRNLLSLFNHILARYYEELILSFSEWRVFLKPWACQMENTEASKAFPKQVFLHNWFPTSNMAQSEWTLKA